MSWIAECDTHGKEFPTCVHVTKTTGTIMHGATYVPIEDSRAVRAEKAALERRIDELCAEVERLRKAKDTMHGDAFEIGAMLVKARDENAKLRELVDELYPLADYGAMDASELDRAHDLMRDAGIEVPDGEV